MNTRQYPRTLQQAFGPYTDNRIVEPRRTFDWQDKVVMIASALALVAVAILVAL